MMDQILAEFRKLWSIRSTYYILGFCLLISLIFDFYAQGYHSTGDVGDPHLLENSVTGTLNAMSFLLGLISALLVTHEYRFNTIMYTLTSSKSRLRVLLAKAIVAAGVAIVIGIIFALLAPMLTDYGLHLKGFAMVTQTFSIPDLAWRTIFFSFASALMGMIIALLIRNQVGTIITLIIFPGTAETLLGLVLKDNVSYLPFTSLNAVLGSAPLASLTHGRAALVVCAYLVVFGAISALLFRQRDAA